MYTHKEGIIFRKIEKSDLADLLQMRDESWTTTHKILAINFDDQIKWYDKISNSNNDLILIGLVENKPVGTAMYTNIDWINRSLDIAGHLYKEYRKPELTKKCFAAGLDFAFEMLNMHRVNAEIVEINYPVHKLDLDFLGFVPEGRKRQAVYKCGHYFDSIILGMLREEWQNSDRIKSYEGSCCTNWSLKIFTKLIEKSQHILEKHG